MPALTRWYIKTSLVYLVLAFLLGLLLAAQNIWALPFSGLFPVYFHLLAEGWITFLIIGVVYWMFPKHSREKPRGSATLGWLSYVCLQTGLLLRVIGEPLNTLQPAMIWAWVLVASAALQWLGGMAFVVNTWSRVKEK